MSSNRRIQTKVGGYSITVGNRSYRFETKPGVFSADGPDPGTTLLLNTILPELKPHQNVLDLGCGVGLLGVPMAAALNTGEAWMVDADIRTTRLAERNLALNGITNAHVVLGDITEDLPPKLRFDVIASNPPTHSGREVLGQFVEQSYTVLRPGGSLWIVINRVLSTKDIMQRVFGNLEVRARDKGFLVLTSQKIRRDRDGI